MAIKTVVISTLVAVSRVRYDSRGFDATLETYKPQVANEIL
jgi:hypothetical protein